MFDFILNRILAQSDWFGRYLEGLHGYAVVAIEKAPDKDLAKVVRPKASGREAHC